MFIAALRVNASCVTSPLIWCLMKHVPGHSSQLKVTGLIRSPPTYCGSAFYSEWEQNWNTSQRMVSRRPCTCVCCGVPQGTVNGRWFWSELKLTDSVECSPWAPGKHCVSRHWFVWLIAAICLLVREIQHMQHMSNKNQASQFIFIRLQPLCRCSLTQTSGKSQKRLPVPRSLVPIQTTYIFKTSAIQI